jgi:Tfp pilus assembly protein PilN
MIVINFASRDYRRMDRLRSGLVALNVLFAAAAVVILWWAMSLRTDIKAMDGKVKEIGAAEDQVRPLLAERDRVTKDLSAMSGLIESRRFSWTRLLTGIEKSFPVGVALGKIDYNPGDHVLSLDGAAQSPESLRNLMIGLERAAVFREPLLKHQSVEKGSISFNVVVFYQGQTAAGVVPGK